MVQSLALSPDNRLLAVGGGGRSLNLWEVDGGKLHRVLMEPEQEED
jgi:WD40 repeat protein